MCEPVSASLLVGATVANSYMQQQRAEEQAENEYEMNVRIADENAKVAQNNLRQQALEQSQSVANERENLELERRRAIASARAGSANSGVGGVSDLRKLIALNTQASEEGAVIDTNLANQQSRLAGEAMGIERDRANRQTQNRATLASKSSSTFDKGLNAGLTGAQTFAGTTGSFGL